MALNKMNREEAPFLMENQLVVSVQASNTERSIKIKNKV